jgi:hypothetical protein
VGALFTVVGLSIAAMAPVSGTGSADRIAMQQLVGGVVVLSGWILLIWGLHRFGRQSRF